MEWLPRVRDMPPNKLPVTLVKPFHPGSNDPDCNVCSAEDSLLNCVRERKYRRCCLLSRRIQPWRCQGSCRVIGRKSIQRAIAIRISSVSGECWTVNLKCHLFKYLFAVVRYDFTHLALRPFPSVTSLRWCYFRTRIRMRASTADTFYPEQNRSLRIAVLRSQ